MFGYAGLVDAIVGRIKAEVDFAPRVVGTGGLAPLIAARGAQHRRVRRHADAARAGDHPRSQPVMGLRLRALLGLPARDRPDPDRARRGARRASRPRAAACATRWRWWSRRVVAFRLPELVHAVLNVAGPTSGAFMRLVALFAGEARHAAWFVLPAAVVVTFSPASGATPDAIWISAPPAIRPVFVAAGLERALAALTGPQPFYASAADAVGAARRRGPGVARRARRARASRPPETAGRGASGRAGARRRAVRRGASPRSPGRAGARRRRRGASRSRWRLTGHGAVWSARNVEVLRPIARGQLAPDFSLPRIDGTARRRRDGALRGQVVVLDFWATWCGALRPDDPGAGRRRTRPGRRAASASSA